jgi:YfiH family protein
MQQYIGLNIGSHVGDVPKHVNANRLYLKELLNLPSEPLWLNQEHGRRIIEAGESDNMNADGIYTDKPGIVCAIMSADCVPLLICDRLGERIAAIHVGWRGFCAGIVSEIISWFNGDKAGLMAWIGPHICPEHYEVGDDVYNACIKQDSDLKHAFTARSNGCWNASLEYMIRHELNSHTVQNITSSEQCTYASSQDFYSYRRDNQTGRMASLIWIDRI